MKEYRKRDQAVIRGTRSEASKPGTEHQGEQRPARTGGEPSRVLSEEELWAIVTEGHLRVIGKESDSETG